MNRDSETRQFDGPILKWTGHPLVDAGVAALTAFADKRTPDEVTAADLDEYAAFAERHYLDGDMRTTVDVLFTRNFLNNMWNQGQKLERVKGAVRSWNQNGDDSLAVCTFCGEAALRVLHRDDIPMLSGRTTFNFYPHGAPGISICGVCQLALHGLTVGAPRCSGKALVISADEPDFLVEIVKEWVARARKYAGLSADSEAFPDMSSPRTRIIEALVRVQQAGTRSMRPVGIVAYHISNGHAPGLDVFALPSTVVHFVRRANTTKYRDAWTAIERRAWQRTSKKGGSAADIAEEQRTEYRNYLYEDLFRLPDDARRFLRIYFLRRAYGLVRRTDIDPRADYQLAAEIDLVSWDLTELFLQEVLGMNTTRIEAIRRLGDRLAEEIAITNDQSILRSAYMLRNPGTMRRLLLRLDLQCFKRDTQPVLGLDDYLSVFEEGEELAHVDWRMAWDLVLIRLIEQLYQSGHIDIVKEVAQEVPEEEEQDTDAAVV